MSTLQRASRSLAKSMDRHAGLPIKYVRQDVCLEIDAAPAASSAYVDEQVGVLEINELDWLVLPELLGVLGEPLRGDKIKVTKNGRDYEYEVGGNQGEDPPWRYVDRHHVYIRIHSTRIRQLPESH